MEKNFQSASSSLPYIGRIAPSPTGAQHLGNARTYVIAWLLSHQNQGKLLLRIEDLDTPRTKPWATDMIFEDLRWLGIEWENASNHSRESGLATTERHSHTPIFQSQRTERYTEVLNRLKQSDLVYPCTCTRTEIEQSASAPHEGSPQKSDNLVNATHEGIVAPTPTLDGAVYAGTCSNRSASDALRLQASGVKFAWRFRFPPHVTFRWQDDFAGGQRLVPSTCLGDFVIARNYGPPAYQLAVVVDDHDSRVNHVVRGDDLVYSTYRQLAIYDALGWSPPRWCHVPLVVGPDGRRLAKRHGDTRLETYRNSGVKRETLLGRIAHSLRLVMEPCDLTPSQLLELAIRSPDWLSQIPKHSVEIHV